MAVSEQTFGPLLDGSSVYLDTSESQWLDSTSGEGPLHVPGGDFVLEAQYSRLGPDLFLSGEEHSVFVKGYFTHEQAPDLYTTDGSAVVRGSIATRLAGPATPGQFAQAELVPRGKSIGEVDKVEGRVFLTHIDGANELAETGTKVFVGDIVETESGSNIGIVFSDETTFALGASGRMVIDDLVYDPVEGISKSTFNVLGGVYSFVSGLIAKSGDDAMSVKTPVPHSITRFCFFLPTCLNGCISTFHTFPVRISTSLGFKNNSSFEIIISVELFPLVSISSFKVLCRSIIVIS